MVTETSEEPTDVPLYSLREEDEEKLFSSISHLLPLRGPDKALL